MKVSGGLVGITLNEATRTKFFLIAPELASLAEQAMSMVGVPYKPQGRHHNLTTALLASEEKGMAQSTATIERFTNRFSDAHTDLFNLAIKMVMPGTVKKDLCEQSEIDRRLFDCFVKEQPLAAHEEEKTPNMGNQCKDGKGDCSRQDCGTSRG